MKINILLFICIIVSLNKTISLSFVNIKYLDGVNSYKSKDIIINKNEEIIFYLKDA